MNTPVRTPLTRAQKQVAERMKNAWLRLKARTSTTQMETAKALGITQGAFTQYLNGHIAANTDFVLRFCRLAEIDPAEVDPALSNVLLTSTHRVPIKYDWCGDALPEGGPVANILIESEEALFGVRVPPEETGLRRWSIAVISRDQSARKNAITFIHARDRKWKLDKDCKGKDCWPVLAFVRER